MLRMSDTLLSLPLRFTLLFYLYSVQYGAELLMDVVILKLCMPFWFSYCLLDFLPGGVLPVSRAISGCLLSSINNLHLLPSPCGLLASWSQLAQFWQFFLSLSRVVVASAWIFSPNGQASVTSSFQASVFVSLQYSCTDLSDQTRARAAPSFF